MVLADAAVTVSVRVPGPAGAAGPQLSPGGPLAHTGFSFVALVLLAVLLVTLGLVLVRRGRTERATSR